MAFLQDYTKAKHSASLIFQLIEKPTDIDSQSDDGDRPVRCTFMTLRSSTYFVMWTNYWLFFPTGLCWLTLVDFQDITGKITFKGVHFSYPTRKAKKILNNMDFTVEPGRTMALVGESGCGKSTVIALLERFYDPSHGSIVSSLILFSSARLVSVKHSCWPMVANQSFFLNWDKIFLKLNEERMVLIKSNRWSIIKLNR